MRCLRGGPLSLGCLPPSRHFRAVGWLIPAFAAANASGPSFAQLFHQYPHLFVGRHQTPPQNAQGSSYLQREPESSNCRHLKVLIVVGQTISRTRRRIPLATARGGVRLGAGAAAAGLANGAAVGVDSTTLEANAALQTLRRKDSKESYREFVSGLAEQAGETVTTVEELIDPAQY